MNIFFQLALRSQRNHSLSFPGGSRRTISNEEEARLSQSSGCREIKEVTGSTQRIEPDA
jgi:hypothetical protein